MATTVQVAAPARTASPLALWHLLSLDAPTVAVVWAWFIARTQHVAIPASSLIAMLLAVWAIYAADRLLDGRRLGQPGTSRSGDFEARHFFHHRHRQLFVPGVAAAILAVAALLPWLSSGAIRLYLLEGFLLMAWFAILHATRSAHRLPKEIAVGIFFSAAVFIPTVARDPGLRVALLPSAFLFGALCSMNCLFIYAWEHEDSRPPRPQGRPAHVTTRFALCRLTPLTYCLLLAAIAVALHYAAAVRLIANACAISLSLLLLLHRLRHDISREHLRAAADLALLTPLLLLPLL